MAFQNHFSDGGEAYRRFRPTYPAALFSFLTRIVPRHGTVWECGAGSGQATSGLARTFARVVATDPSHDQLRLAEIGDGHRVVCTAEAAPLATRSADLVAVAQALHWFEHGRFFDEVRRVLLPGGVLAVWTYGLPEVGPDLDPELRSFAHETVGRFWPPGRHHVEAAYRSIEFPFEELSSPDFEMEHELDAASFFGYLRTWSAVRRARAGLDADPVDRIEQRWRGRWPSGATRAVRWPLTSRIFRVHPA